MLLLCLIFRLTSCLYVCTCFASVVFAGGSTGQWWGGGPLLKWFMVFSGGLPAWATSVM